MKRQGHILNPEYECMDREQRRILQGERLRETVKREYENVPLYRARMKEKGVEPGDIKTAEDIRYLPFTEKTDLRDTFPFGLLAAPKSEIVRIHGSSGTTGKPIVVGYTQNDIDVWTELAARALSAAGCTKDDIVQVCYGYGLFTGGLGVHQGASKIGAMVVPMSSGNTQRQLMMMKELGATMLCCTPSYAQFLGESLGEMGIDKSELSLMSGCFGAEPWSEGMRTHIENLLGIDCCDIYGLTEIAGPGVSFECLYKKGMHVNEDHVIVEIIDPETGEPLPVGKEGELVFTTITKTGMPMIRYRTRDLCVLDDSACECGRTTVRMKRICGRSDDMIIVRGVNVFPSQIESILVEVKGVTPNYMIIVDRENSHDILEVKVELAPDMRSDSVSEYEKLRSYITEQIKSVVGVGAKVSLVPSKSLPRFEGKARRVDDRRKY